MTTEQVFAADLTSMNAALIAADAVVTEADGFQWIDATRVPAQLVSAYQGLTRYGYANGLI